MYDDVVGMKPGELRTIQVKVNYGHCKPLILAALQLRVAGPTLTSDELP